MAETSTTTTSSPKKRKERAYAEHQPKWQRFQVSLMKPATKTAAASAGSSVKPLLHPYQRQYAHVYHQRLAALKPRCWETFDQQQRTNNNVDPPQRMERILELRENVRSVLVGTIVKEGGNGDIENTTTSSSRLHPESRCLEGQSLFVEDESGRANLVVDNVHNFCTGMVLGLQGTVSADGCFQVEEVFYPAMPPQPSIGSKDDDATSSDGDALVPHLLLLSGLNCGDPDVSPLRRDNILSYLRGHFGASTAAKVAHVVIAGGSTTGHDEHPTVGLKELDSFCYQVCLAGVPVDILPGRDDPTTANWPQRPLHKSLLKNSDTKMPALLSRVPNPYGAVLHHQYLLGTDGTNVTDLSRSLLKRNTAHNTQDGSEADQPTLVPVSHLEALRRTLQCGHICPTGPNTVPTMPHAEADPMVLSATETPHIYFAGNCDAFDTEVMECQDHAGTSMKIRLICVPTFSKTGEAVLVNLETLQTKSIQFPDPPN